ncbi:alkene reductase [Microseira sp. BLCC-F43]|jgi:N-ethylmaleimide reductase|uniref:oxidoreductase n=1 Tax=Microseira sp. BLCC-F43 TaxID=3153602 RepID=UPI0035BB2088
MDLSHFKVFSDGLFAIAATLVVLEMSIKSMTKLKLLSPAILGDLELPNRMIMAPLTRCRAGDGYIPQPMNAIYYAQRASAGLIIAEATQVARNGIGYPNTPGIYTSEQVEGWKQVTNAVHARGGRIFLQLWHAGRVAHPSLLPANEIPIAPSAIPANCLADTAEGQQPHVTPRALELAEIPGIVEQFRQGAKNAIAAGFDGVEIHSANGYLLDQFLQDNSNQRLDEYGGSIQNRARLLLEVVQAALEVWGQGKVGVRLSPSSSFNDMKDSNPTATFSYVADALNQFGLAYLHVIEPRIQGNVTITNDGSGLGVTFFRKLFQGKIIAAGGYSCETGEAVLQKNHADFIAYGRLFLANPDLPKRFAINAPLNRYDRATFYSSGERGYTDYPSLDLLHS